MSEDHINFLLNKYNNRYTSGEYISKDYLAKMKEEGKIRELIDITTRICNQYEIPKNIKDDVVYWLKKFKNIEFIRGNWSREKCITVLLFNQMQFHNTRFVPKQHPLWRKYEFTWKDYSIARSNLFKEIIQNHCILNSPKNVERYQKLVGDKE